MWRNKLKANHHPYLHKTLKDNGDIKVVGSNQRFKKTLCVTWGKIQQTVKVSAAADHGRDRDYFLAKKAWLGTGPTLWASHVSVHCLVRAQGGEFPAKISAGGISPEWCFKHTIVGWQLKWLSTVLLHPYSIQNVNGSAWNAASLHVSRAHQWVVPFPGLLAKCINFVWVKGWKRLMLALEVTDCGRYSCWWEQC